MERELLITRVFDTPRELVWKAWTDPKIVKRWWGPKNFTAPYIKMDVRVGGKYLSCMRGPDGKDYWSTGTYREIVPEERIAVTDSFADENGNIVPATHYGMSPDIPLEMMLTATFEERNGKTQLTLNHVGLTPGPAMEDARQGWNECLDKLAEVLRS